jgi:ubiquinone/menaquinone biosynthesis C-methylase UbiE
MSSESEQIALGYYKRLGPERMQRRFSADHTNTCIQLVLSYTSSKHRILDAGCGAGRICVPLAMRGMRMTGVDLSPDMINAARKHAEINSCCIILKVGSLLNLPFASNSFDRMFCFRTFNHLLHRKEQLCAMNEMLRVLDVGGIAMVEVNNGESKKLREHLRLNGRGIDGRVVELPVEDLTNIAYIHDKGTLESLADESTAIRYKTKFVNIAHRRRITLWLWN